MQLKSTFNFYLSIKTGLLTKEITITASLMQKRYSQNVIFAYFMCSLQDFSQHIQLLFYRYFSSILYEKEK